MSRPTNQIEKIYEEYFQEITKYLYRRTGNVETAKDLAQDVFIKALHGLSSLKDIQALKHGFTPLLIIRLSTTIAEK